MKRNTFFQQDKIDVRNQINEIILEKLLKSENKN